MQPTFTPSGAAAEGRMQGNGSESDESEGGYPPLNIGKESPMTGIGKSSYTVATLEVPQAFFEFIATKLIDAGYGHAFMDPETIDMSGVALVPNPNLPEAEWRPSKDSKAMVSKYKFLPPAPEHKGMKCILQGPGDVPTIAIYDGDPQWKGVFPLPDLLP
jgi:hypothetical protein